MVTNTQFDYSSKSYPSPGRAYFTPVTERRNYLSVTPNTTIIVITQAVIIPIGKKIYDNG